MARPKSLTTMSVDLLIKMRDDITAALASTSLINAQAAPKSWPQWAQITGKRGGG
jgi:hypothetical protein